MSLPTRFTPALLALVLLLPLAAGASRGQGHYGGRIQPVRPRHPHVATAPKPAPDIPLGADFMSGDLDRITVGNQAGIIKIMARDRQTVLFCKDIPGCDLRGIDSTDCAPVTPAHRAAILNALDIRADEVDAVAHNLMRHFGAIEKYPAVGLLGVIASAPDDDLAPTTAADIRDFLERTLDRSQDVRLHRLAVLSMAVIPTVDDHEIASVIDFMTASHNAWETFTTQQFFQYHHDYLADRQDLLGRVAASGNPYADDILRDFQ